MNTMGKKCESFGILSNSLIYLLPTDIDKVVLRECYERIMHAKTITHSVSLLSPNTSEKWNSRFLVRALRLQRAWSLLSRERSHQNLKTSPFQGFLTVRLVSFKQNAS